MRRVTESIQQPTSAGTTGDFLFMASEMRWRDCFSGWMLWFSICCWSESSLDGHLPEPGHYSHSAVYKICMYGKTV